jgi:hypothetical protein
VPDKTALWALLAGLGALFLLALLIQGPSGRLASSSISPDTCAS